MNRVPSELFQLIQEDFENHPAFNLNYPLPVLNGYLIKHSIYNKNENYNYVFFSHNDKHSINCIFDNQSESLPDTTLLNITISKYFFDLFLRVQKENELEYNIVLYIQSYLIPEETSKPSITIPPNINKDSHLKSSTDELFFFLIEVYYIKYVTI